MLGRAEIERRGEGSLARVGVRVVSSVLEFSKITHRVESDLLFFKSCFGQLIYPATVLGRYFVNN
jgi:hypothetical protein